MTIKPEEWVEFAEFIARKSTHMISSYWEDGVYTACPFTTIEKAYAAFILHQVGRKDEMKQFMDIDVQAQNPDYDYSDVYTDNSDCIDYDEYLESLEHNPFHSWSAAFDELEDKYWDYLYPCEVGFEEAFDRFERQNFWESQEEEEYDEWLAEQEALNEAETVNEWLTHEGVNYQIFEEIRKCEEAKRITELNQFNNHLATKTIMKIQFKSWGETDEYPISSISYSIEGNAPIDIFIAGHKEVLEAIAEKHGSIGFNIRELDELEARQYGANYQALYGRLEPFEITDAYTVQMKS